MPGNLSLNTKLRARTLIIREMGKFILALLKKKITPNVIKTSDKQDFLEKKRRMSLFMRGGFALLQGLGSIPKFRRKNLRPSKLWIYL